MSFFDISGKIMPISKYNLCGKTINKFFKKTDSGT